MKLINIKTELTFSELVSKFENVPLVELEVIFNMSKYFDYVDVSYPDKKSGFFAILADSYTERLEDFLQKQSIVYCCKDLSKDVFFDNPIDCEFVDETGRDISLRVKEIFTKFRNNFITQDDVLDKILEKGIESLTDFDKSILK